MCGLTPEQAQMLQRLLIEFGPTIAAIRGDIQCLSDRLSTVEAAVARIPPLRVSIAGGVRFGWQGTDIEWNQPDQATVADNADIYAASVLGIVDESLAKDMLKGNRYGVYRADINIDGNITDSVAAHATLRAITPVNFDENPYESFLNGFNEDFPPATVTDPLNNIYYPVPVNTWSDQVQLWDWYATFTTPFFGRNLGFTAGRHSNSIAQGLLVDTYRQPLVGVSADTGAGGFLFGGNSSYIDRSVGVVDEDTGEYVLPLDPEVEQDSYSYAYIGGQFGTVSLVGTYLFTGFMEEEGWSIGADACIFGARIFGEYAEQKKNIFDEDIDDNNSGWVVGVDLLNNWKGISLTGKYGEIQENYRPIFSTLFPYALVNAYDTNWVDRPLFLDPFNVTKGWEANLGINFGRDWMLSARAYDGDHITNTSNTDADFVWTVSLKKKVNAGITASLLYGQREVNVLNGGDEFTDGEEFTDDYKLFRAAIEFVL